MALSPFLAVPLHVTAFLGWLDGDPLMGSAFSLYQAPPPLRLTLHRQRTPERRTYSDRINQAQRNYQTQKEYASSTMSKLLLSRLFTAALATVAQNQDTVHSK